MQGTNTQDDCAEPDAVTAIKVLGIAIVSAGLVNLTVRGGGRGRSVRRGTSSGSRSVIIRWHLEQNWACKRLGEFTSPSSELTFYRDLRDSVAKIGSESQLKLRTRICGTPQY